MFREFKKSLTIAILASFAFSFAVVQRNAEAAGTEAAIDARQSVEYGRFPVLFEENKGQTDRAARFVSRVSGGYSVYLTEKGAVFSLKYAAEEQNPAQEVEHSKMKQATPTKSEQVRMEFVGANERPQISGSDAAITKTNYYTNRKRLENISNYRKVNYSGLYNGIDALFYGNPDNQLEYDFIVAPNADASQIGLKFDGAESMSIDESGNLVIKTENTELVQQEPFAYQEIDGERKEVAVNYQIKDQSPKTDDQKTVGFFVGDYDRSRPLVIDPALSYLTYIGGTAFDDVFEVAADAQGNAYISGDTESLNFHGQTRQSNDGTAAYVAKINADGTDFVYITILEGNSDDRGSGITIDANNNVFVVGQGTRDFPVTPNAFDTFLGLNEADGFAAKLDGDGTLVYATYIGGSAGDDLAFDVAVDAAGKAYVTGRTDSGTSFPQKNRYQGCGFAISTNSPDAYLTVLNAAGSDITYSTCFGGSFVGQEAGFSIALDAANNAYITGLTTAGNFPTKNAFQPDKSSGTDAFVVKFNPSASGEASLVYSTFLGGSGTDEGNAVAVDAVGQAHVVGLTGSTNFPLKNAFRSTNQINEAFVTVLNTSGNALVNSSFLGGADQDEANNITLGRGGQIYVTGQTLSNDFPMALPFQAARRGLRDAFVTKLAFGRGVISSSFLGGNGNDFGDGIAVRGNSIFVVGRTESNNLLTTNGVIKSTSTANSTNPDGFVAKILDTRLESVGVFRPATTFILTQSITNVAGQNATFTTGLSGARGVSGDWDGDGIDTIGSFTNGTWKIRNSNFPIINPPFGGGISTINFGQAGDLPVVGDWNNDGIDTIAVFRPSTGQFFATNSLVANPPVDFTVTFGQNGDLPVAGDWNGDGVDTMGVYSPGTGQFFLTNTNDFNASIDLTTFFGVAEDLPFAGDFNGDGIDTISVWRPSVVTFFITNDNTSLATAFPFGAAGDQPIAGDWDGRPLP